MAKVTYRFSCEEYDGEKDAGNPFPASKDTSMEVVFDDSVAWPHVLKQFAQFLGAVYGYDIVKDIVTKETDLDKYE